MGHRPGLKVNIALSALLAITALSLAIPGDARSEPLACQPGAPCGHRWAENVASACGDPTHGRRYPDQDCIDAGSIRLIHYGAI